MVKLAFLIRSLDYGGAERQLVTLAKNLDKTCFEIAVFCFYTGGALASELKESNVRLVFLGKQGRWDSLGFLWRLRHQLQQFNPDLLHSYLGVANLLAIGLKPFLPKTRIIWGVRASNMDLSRYDWLSQLVFRLECFFARFAPLIIVNSNAGKRYHVARGFPETRMLAIPNGIDLERFKPDPIARDRVRIDWQLAADEVAIGLVGRLDPMKDHPTFLRAAAIASAQKQNLRFICIGSGPAEYGQQLQQLTAKLNLSQVVSWAGARADMPAVYNALDIFCSASAYGECFSNAIGEAMASGLPCVVTNVGDSAWIVGETGIVVPPQNPEALAAAWLKLLKQQEQQSLAVESFPQIERARSRIIEQFSLKILVQKTSQALLASNPTNSP